MSTRLLLDRLAGLAEFLHWQRSGPLRNSGAGPKNWRRWATVPKNSAKGLRSGSKTVLWANHAGPPASLVILARQAS